MLSAGSKPPSEREPLAGVGVLKREQTETPGTVQADSTGVSNRLEATNRRSWTRR
jgi:hypothetical protein